MSEGRDSIPALRAKKPTHASSTGTGALQAVLLYEHWERPYFDSIGDKNQKYKFIAECVPTSPGAKAIQTLYLALPQPRYTVSGQCQAILQSEAVEGIKELLTGLRPVAVSALLKAPALQSIFVGDFKLKRHEKKPAPTAVVIVGKSEASRSGWMLVMVVDRRYNRRSRAANERTAHATVADVLPLLPSWLNLLPTEVTA